MSANTDRFQELAQQVIPLDAQAAPIKLEMVNLSSEISLEIMTAAFPKAFVMRTRAVSEIKPSDGGKNALQAVTMLKEHGITPTLLVLDTARHIVLACIEPLPAASLPKKAKPPAIPRKKHGKNSK